MRALSLCLCLLLFLSPARALAVGEDDPIWQRSTFERKVSDVGHKILRDNAIKDNIFFRIAPTTQDVNAYADSYTSDNSVVVTKGLLNYLKNDDELAAILSHEIVHLLRNHQAKRVAKRTGVAVGLAVLLAAAGADDDPDNDNGYFSRKRRADHGRLENLNFHLGVFEQKYETEADLLGMDLMARAGYNPRAMETVIGMIAGDRPGTKFWATHPEGKKRLADIRKHLEAMTTHPVVAASPSSPAPSSPSLEPASEVTKDRDQEAKLPLQPASNPGNTSLSLSQTLLTLNPAELDLFKAIASRSFYEEDQLKRDYFEAATPEHMESLLHGLTVKKLIRIVGTSPERIFLLSDRAAQELK